MCGLKACSARDSKLDVCFRTKFDQVFWELDFIAAVSYPVWLFFTIIWQTLWDDTVVLTVIMCAFPQGSVLFNYFSHGKLERSEGSSITEGQPWSSTREKVNISFCHVFQAQYWIEIHPLWGCMNIWYIFAAHMSPVCNGNTAIQCFDARSRILFDLYVGLSHNICQYKLE